MYDAINRGWQHARGDVLSWLNSDEQYLPGTLKRIGAVFEQNPGVDFVYGDVLIVNASGDLIAARREIRLSKIYISNSFLNAPSCTTFFRRRLWDEGILRLDTAYRYAADMDLILRLLHAGKSYYKLSAYLSAFTMDGTNLSCHPGMLEETDMVQRKFGAFTSPLLRRAVTLGRYAERLLTGSYKRVDLAYEFASDEHPHYRTIIGRSLPGSYRTR